MKAQAQKLLKEMNTGIFEKEEPMRFALLAAVAGESIFLLGPPGVAKSLLARRLKAAFKDARSFEYLMNRFSTPDEIFGPVSISKLKNEDKYERNVENYLPGADVVFLDEIWKAGPSIQNALLTVINEKVYRNGDTEIAVPMKALIAASNELPAKGEGLEALWDRFILRYYVKGIQHPENFNQMIATVTDAAITMPPALQITGKQYQKFSGQINAVTVPEHIFRVIHAIRGVLQSRDNPLYISDRRWKKVVRLLRTSAFINDRATVDLSDCFLITHCLWDTPEQVELLQTTVSDAVTRSGYLEIYRELESIEQELARIEAAGHDQARQVKVVEAVLGQLQKKIQQATRELEVFKTNLFLTAKQYTLLEGHLEFLQQEAEKAAFEAERVSEMEPGAEPPAQPAAPAKKNPVVVPVAPLPHAPAAPLSALGDKCAEVLANAKCTSQSDVRRLLFNHNRDLLTQGTHTLEFMDNGPHGANRLYKLKITHMDTKESVEIPVGPDRFIKLLHLHKS